MDHSDEESDQANEIERNQLVKALHFKIGSICREEEAEENEKEGSTLNYITRMSPSAINALTELTFHFVTECLGPDLIRFCKHANRKTITVDDVKLAARKNPRGLLDSLDFFCEDIRDQMTDMGPKNGNQKKRSRNFRDESLSPVLDQQKHPSNSIGLQINGDSSVSYSDQSLGVGPSSDKIGRTATDGIQFKLQINSSPSSESGNEDDFDNDDESGSDHVTSRNSGTSATSQHNNTGVTMKLPSVLDDSDSEDEFQTTINGRLSPGGESQKKAPVDVELIDLLDSD